MVFTIRRVESRQVASTGKMLLAVALANQGRDTADSLYADPQAPAQGLDTCAKGGSAGNRKAVVAFACSLNAPLINRGAQLGQAPIKRLIDGFGFTMPPAAELGGTPPSTAVVLGQIAGAPRRVQFMSSVILASLIGRGTKPVRPPTLITAYDYTQKGEGGAGITAEARPAIIPKSLIRPGAVWLITVLLEAPLCYQTGGQSYGTLKSLSQWCARRRGDLRLHFAKTGTSVSLDPERHRRCLGLRRTAVHERRRLFLCRARRHRHRVTAVGARSARCSNCSALARRLAPRPRRSCESEPAPEFTSAPPSRSGTGRKSSHCSGNSGVRRNDCAQSIAVGRTTPHSDGELTFRIILG